MADNITVLDSAEVETTVATHDIGSNVHASKVVLVGSTGEMLSGDGYFDVPSGGIQGKSSVNKFGYNSDVDQVQTDVWDGSAETWEAPTQARIHQISSTSASDTGSPVGTGARTIKIYGLVDWDTPESNETITMNGTGDVATTNSYVIIHRMKVTTKGSSGPNVGTITATADDDLTVTAQINAGEGQTQMAIYGIASSQTAYMIKYYASAIKAASSLAVEVRVLVNPEPDAELTGFLTKHIVGLATEGSNYMSHDFKPYSQIQGPAIIKIAANSSADNTKVAAGFDLGLATS